MTIAVVQTLPVAAASGSFASNVTAGNTVFIVPACFNGTWDTITTSNAQFNGATPAGTTLLTSAQNANGGGPAVYTGVWMLPNVAGGAKGVAFTVSAGDSALGMTCYEVSGLGASPQLDPGGGTAVASGTSGAVTGSGAAPSTADAAVIAIGSALQFAVAVSGPGSPWSNPATYSGFEVSGSQVISGAGAAPAYAATSGGSAAWAACIAVIGPQAAPAVTGRSLVVSQAVKRAAYY